MEQLKCRTYVFLGLLENNAMEKTAEEKTKKTYKNRCTKQSRDTVNVGARWWNPDAGP